MPAQSMPANRLVFRCVSSVIWLPVLSHHCQCCHKKGAELGVTTSAVNTYIMQPPPRTQRVLKPPDRVLLSKPAHQLKQPLSRLESPLLWSLFLCQSVCSPSSGSLSIWHNTFLEEPAKAWLPNGFTLLNSSGVWLWFWNKRALLFLTAVLQGQWQRSLSVLRIMNAVRFLIWELLKGQTQPY